MIKLEPYKPKTGQYVYALVDPETCNIKYVGACTFDPIYRVQAHAHSMHKNEEFQKWLDCVKSRFNGLLYITLQKTNYFNCFNREGYWTQFFKQSGYSLFNFMNNVSDKQIRFRRKNIIVDVYVGNTWKRAFYKKIQIDKYGKITPLN